LSRLKEFEQGVIQAERPFAQNLRDGDVTYYDLEELLRSELAAVIVAEIGGEIIASGFIRIEKEKPHFKPASYGYIGFLYVTPDYRGKGIIVLLVEELMNWARERNIKSFKLEVFNKNKSALRAYEKLGFVAEMQLMLKLD
jgi:ribosomal protein S18 acetylase RimI-like enzyme